MAEVARDARFKEWRWEDQPMSNESRPTHNPNQPPLSPENQLRLFLGLAAVVLFVIAGWIFLSNGDASRAFAFLSFGLAGVAGCVMIPPPPAK